MSYMNKSLSELDNKDVEQIIYDYLDWLNKNPKHVTWSAFCRSKGIKNPYRFKSYLMMNFTGLDNTIDFQQLWTEAEHIREDKLVELGLFDKKVNANFLTSWMKSRFGWHDNAVIMGVSVDDIMQAKQQASRIVKPKIKVGTEGKGG